MYVCVYVFMYVCECVCMRMCICKVAIASSPGSPLRVPVIIASDDL